MAFDHVDTFLACMSENSPSNFEVRITNTFSSASRIVGFATLEEAQQRLEAVEFWEDAELLCDHTSTTTERVPGYGMDEPWQRERCDRCHQIVTVEPVKADWPEEEIPF